MVTHHGKGRSLCPKSVEREVCVCVCVCVCVYVCVCAQACLTLCNLPTRRLCPWDFPGKNTGAG